VRLSPQPGGGERVTPERLEEIRAWAASRHLRGGPHPVAELLDELDRLTIILRQWHAYDLALADGRSEDAAILGEAVREALAGVSE
jgi:hypothetical protein